MEYLRLLYELPAIVAGAAIIAYLLPVKMEVRFVPLLMFLIALLVLWLPAFIDLALCLTIPATWLQERVLGIELHGHEPLKIPVPKLPVRAPLREFVTRAYPAPGTEANTGEPDAVPDQEPGETVSAVKSFVPSL